MWRRRRPARTAILMSRMKRARLPWRGSVFLDMGAFLSVALCQSRSRVTLRRTFGGAMSGRRCTGAARSWASASQPAGIGKKPTSAARAPTAPRSIPETVCSSASAATRPCVVIAKRQKKEAHRAHGSSPAIRSLSISREYLLIDGGDLRLAKVARRVVADGGMYEVACAVGRDGKTAPASDLLDDLETGMWADPNAKSLPDEWQPRLRTRLLAHVNQLANEGDLPGSAYNRLEEGVWELKVESVRVTFYDTDGAGGWSPKYGERVGMGSWARWELPDFDEFLRLGHCFAKETQSTPPDDIRASCTVREEDVEHDRES